jgi:exopolysaccharide biosynthesis polyprenyl glycosylphosphotransferase
VEKTGATTPAVSGTDEQRPSATKRRFGRISTASSWLIPFAALCMDVLCVSIALGVAAYASNRYAGSGYDPGVEGPLLTVVVPLLLIGWILSITFVGGYDERTFGAGSEEFRRIFNSSFIVLALIGCACYLAQYPLSRSFFFTALVLTPLLLLDGRMILRLLLKGARRRGLLGHRVMIVGAANHVLEVKEVLDRESWLGYQVVGSLAPERTPRPVDWSGPLPWQAARTAAMARALRADVVFLAGGAFSSSTEMRRLAWELEHEAIQVIIAPSVTDVSSERVSVRPVGGLPLIHLEKPRSADAVRRAKRTFDIVLTMVLIVLASPLLIVAAAHVWLNDRGPVLFGQTRIGRDAKPFRVWKFRTMVTNAEELLSELHDREGYEGGLFKMADDPRVTRPGRWLRRFSVDELPQLFNVLRGEMSLVGPRPPLGHEVAQYSDDVARRLRVRPGMTGLWQVSGRSDLSWSEAIRLDLYYVDNWSMVQDLTILARTFGAVVGSRGAY